MSLHLAQPWLLLLAPLALLPWIFSSGNSLNYSWLGLIPRDPVSDWLGRLLKLLATVAIAATALGLAGPYRAEQTVERIGKGAEIVLLLDRSRSMDQPFARRPSAAGLEDGTTRSESKGKVARQLLAEFTQNRGHDLIAMVAFSTFPIRVTGFTQKQEVIQAAIRAGDVGRGLADTDIGQGILATLSYFEGRPYNGSRIIVMVSDGGARLDVDTRERITRLMKRERVALYWLYLRSYRSPGLLADDTLAAEDQDAVPEHFLHKFFQGMGTPYRAYEAENPQALQGAMQDVSRLENLPIRYRDVLPRRDLAGACYQLALVCTLFLLAARFMELRQWS
jgi:mxaC protein